MPLKKLYDGPLFGSGPGVLTELKNMRIRPGGYAEARGGLERLQNSGGTATAPITTGGIVAGIELATSGGWIMTYKDGITTYSKNLQMKQGYIFLGSNGLAARVNDAIYFGCDFTFSRVAVLLSIAANWNVTIVYEYWNGAAWTALTTTETITFTSLAQQYASWVVPTDWAATYVGDAAVGRVYKIWMRIRVSAAVATVTLPSAYSAYGHWPGMREIYLTSSDPRTAVANGKFMRRGVNAGTDEWFAVNSGLFSGSTCPTRLATYRGRVFLVNSKDAKWWDGAYFADIGLAKLTSATTLLLTAGAGLDAGVWRYYAAWGYGLAQDLTSAQPCDPQSLYGVGQAAYLGEMTTTVPNGQVTITLTGGNSPGNGELALYIYRTQDLTNVAASARPTFPAFLITSMRVTSDSPAPLEAGGVYVDSTRGNLFPPVEAVLYDNLPPAGAKFLAFYQNRLFLGTDTKWYWSDAFKPDNFQRAFNYIDLTRSLGGRNMGGIEFGDQMVLFTEDQTWGITNVDLDAPHLYPIHPGVGCIAPGSIAVGDGLIVWLSRDGFYAWDGSRNPPRKVSSDLFQTFEKKGYESMGGGFAVIHNHRYDFWGMDPALNTPAANGYSLDLETFTWGTLSIGALSSTIVPLCLVNGPLGHADFGVPHPLFAKRDVTTAAGDYFVYMGERTTADNGTGYECAATMHFPIPANATFKPNGVLAYYAADAGWGTPTLAWAGTTSPIGSTVGTINASTPDSGGDYTIITGTFSQQSSGSSDLLVRFAVTSASGGTVGRQRFHGGILTGTDGPMRRTI